jgi:hypothetical protein
MKIAIFIFVSLWVVIEAKNQRRNGGKAKLSNPEDQVQKF